MLLAENRVSWFGRQPFLELNFLEVRLLIVKEAYSFVVSYLKTAFYTK
jgi:hypothetical protein